MPVYRMERKADHEKTRIILWKRGQRKIKYKLSIENLNNLLICGFFFYVNEIGFNKNSFISFWYLRGKI